MGRGRGAAKGGIGVRNDGRVVALGVEEGDGSVLDADIGIRGVRDGCWDLGSGGCVAIDWSQCLFVMKGFIHVYT